MGGLLKNKMGKNLEKRVKTKVIKIKPLSDERGKYIPWCSYHWHTGISRTPEVCQARDCKHFYKLYIETGR